MDGFLCLQDTITYELSSGEANALDFFFIEEESGIIMLKKPLTEGSSTTYKVSRKQTSTLFLLSHSHCISNICK